MLTFLSICIYNAFLQKKSFSIIWCIVSVSLFFFRFQQFSRVFSVVQFAVKSYTSCSKDTGLNFKFYPERLQFYWLLFIAVLLQKIPVIIHGNISPAFFNI